MYIVSIRQGQAHWFVGQSKPVVTLRAAVRFPEQHKARVAAKRAKRRDPDSTVSIFRGLSRVETL